MVTIRRIGMRRVWRYMKPLEACADNHTKMEAAFSMMAMTDSEINQYMIAALVEAKKAAAIGEVPIGAVVVHDQQIIGRGYNLRETTQDATQHAEILAIQAACRQLGTWRLEDCSLFVTLEPCPMCAGAMINARIATCYFGATDPKAG